MLFFWGGGGGGGGGGRVYDGSCGNRVMGTGGGSKRQGLSRICIGANFSRINNIGTMVDHTLLLQPHPLLYDAQ